MPDSDGSVDVEQTLTERAYQLLSRREYSVHELKTRFRDAGSEQQIYNVIEKLIATNAQSDKRYAEMICRARFNAGKGPVRILHDLNQNQIDPNLIEAAMAEYECLWQNRADDVRIRKFGERPPQTYQEWTRQARFLQQRGFQAAHIPDFGEMSRRIKNDYENQ